ncbi:hypothetical protein SLEP1_g18671 [Rubroshorea leprosula]|uniref:Uncharacterized protein n=1 Tax=Rubroshorea leprosula TaxID=152421 RepID=A0AAV5J3V2_9ROSI|nr:hypothetical protein SLEP1_g18671 [Rubroshorea leprosula]
MGDEHEATDRLATRIDEKLPSFSTVSLPMCFKVPNLLRQTNEKAYEPQIISIGPYHHGKDHLKGMEAHKMFYLNRLLQRRGETGVRKYVMALKDKEEKIRKCYAEPLIHNIDGDALVEMMLLDGCFIIEIIRKYQTWNCGELRERNDNFPNFNVVSIACDLLLVENQLPFFVLSELFHMTREPNQENVHGFILTALDFFSRVMPGCGNGIEPPFVISDQITKYLLGLVLDSWVPSAEARLNYNQSSEEYGGWNFKRSAIELREAGIKFKKMDNEKSFFDIKFENGVLWIPTIEMYDYTDSILRNFIAHEQSHNKHPRYVTDYVTFMDCLINTRNDVELLRQSGIIVNGLGDDEDVATIFNGLCDSIVFSNENFYSEIINNVEKYSGSKWNLWMENLKHNYFNTPWALISFLAAVSLLILTVVQTIYSLLSYYNTVKLFS